MLRSFQNDPWDFKPWFSHEPMLSDPRSLERMLEMFRASAGPELINDPVRPLFEARVRQDPRQLNLMALVLTKAIDWAYECEFRIIGIPNAALRGTPNSLDGHYLHLPPGALSAIIIGCEAPRDEITLLVRELAPGLPVKQAQRIPDRYELEII